MSFRSSIASGSFPLPFVMTIVLSIFLAALTSMVIRCLDLACLSLSLHVKCNVFLFHSMFFFIIHPRSHFCENFSGLLQDHPFIFPKHLAHDSIVEFVAFYYNYKYFSFFCNLLCPPIEGNINFDSPNA